MNGYSKVISGWDYVASQQLKSQLLPESLA